MAADEEFEFSDDDDELLEDEEVQLYLRDVCASRSPVELRIDAGPPGPKKQTGFGDGEEGEDEDMYSEEEAVEFGEEEEGQEEGEDIDVDDQEAMDFLRAAEEGNVLGVKVAADVVRCVRSAVSGTDINGACARWFWRSQTCWTCKTSWGTPRRISQ
eukprot:1909960-Rhodomonas_salina.1